MADPLAVPAPPATAFPMSYGSRATQYLEADVMSRSPEWLVPLLYEHLLASLRRAALQIGARDLEGKAVSLGRASDIILELSTALDHERGGALAGQLAALYAFLAGEILSVGRTLDVKRLERLAGIVSELHEAWVHAAEEVAPRARAGQPARLAAAV